MCPATEIVCVGFQRYKRIFDRNRKIKKTTYTAFLKNKAQASINVLRRRIVAKPKAPATIVKSRRINRTGNHQANDQG